MRLFTPILIVMLLCPCIAHATLSANPFIEADHWAYDVVHLWMDEGLLDEFAGVLPAESIDAYNRLTRNDLYEITAYLLLKHESVLADDGVLRCLADGMEREFVTNDFDRSNDTAVHTDHWAYSALDYLQQNGYLTGYPDGFFRGGPRTRYTFEQAIAQLLDTASNSDETDENIKVMLETLRAEFSQQLCIFF